MYGKKLQQLEQGDWKVSLLLPCLDLRLFWSFPLPCLDVRSCAAGGGEVMMGMGKDGAYQVTRPVPLPKFRDGTVVNSERVTLTVKLCDKVRYETYCK